MGLGKQEFGDSRIIGYVFEVCDLMDFKLFRNVEIEKGKRTIGKE